MQPQLGWNARNATIEGAFEQHRLWKHKLKRWGKIGCRGDRLACGRSRFRAYELRARSGLLADRLAGRWRATIAPAGRTGTRIPAVPGCPGRVWRPRVRRPTPAARCGGDYWWLWRTSNLIVADVRLRLVCCPSGAFVVSQKLVQQRHVNTPGPSVWKQRRTVARCVHADRHLLAEFGPTRCRDSPATTITGKRQRAAFLRLELDIPPTRVPGAVPPQAFTNDCRADVGAVVQVAHTHLAVVCLLAG